MGIVDVDNVAFIVAAVDAAIAAAAVAAAVVVIAVCVFTLHKIATPIRY